jgi:glutamate-1-semialdehyde 2,1-aminomutase
MVEMSEHMTENHRVVAVVQARLGSKRFPRKVLSLVSDKSALEVLITRLKQADTINQIVLAIPLSSENDELLSVAKDLKIECVRGSENDVLDRFYIAAKGSNPDLVVRITGDCPLVDPKLVDQVVHLCIDNNYEYASTNESFPDGLDVEVFKFETLTAAWLKSTNAHDREHVTPFVRKLAGSNSGSITSKDDNSQIRVTLDETDDLIVIREVLRQLGNNNFTYDDLCQLISDYPDIFMANAHLSRNEGATMNTGEKLWRRAKKVIPGGNMLLSKRTEMHLQKGWPAYFSRAQGCRVWDLDGNEYIDAGLFGIGTNILGFGHPKVDEAVLEVVRSGNMSTLNCPEEVYLAERLVAMHEWAGMVRLTRSGGEACAVAARIGRAYSGKSTIAFCGYHGWHDWYLAANLSEDAALDGHLLPGLNPAGVPRGLAGSAKPFAYNDREALVKILEEGDVGVIFMEVRRGSEPDPGFLEGVRALATQYGAVLIFDECTSGFRKTFGGLHLDYGVDPDIATFGKTLGNGYAINAIVGRTEVMQAAQDTFISSTFWTERIGPAAALATLDVMESEDAPARIHAIGLKVKEMWESTGHNVGINVITAGVPSIGTYSIEGFDPIVTKTFVTQEMLKRGFIAGNALYASIEHTEQILDQYFSNLLPIFQEISNSGSTDQLLKRLDDGPAQSGFQRLA